MKAYELLYFVDPAASEEMRAGAMKRIEVAITANGGTIDSVEDWGKRSPRATTPSSTSMQIPTISPSSIEFCASTTL